MVSQALSFVPNRGISAALLSVGKEEDRRRRRGQVSAEVVVVAVERRKIHPFSCEDFCGLLLLKVQKNEKEDQN